MPLKEVTRASERTTALRTRKKDILSSVFANIMSSGRQKGRWGKMRGTTGKVLPLGVSCVAEKNGDKSRSRVAEGKSFAITGAY